jgi:Arc/MetJ-type ribon-helix-helix transcriptional regulator
MADTEKVTINMSVVDLGQVDLLVEQGFYSSRTDFIRTAIRRQLDSHAEEVRQTVARKTLAIGALSFSRQDLERWQTAGEVRDIRVVGLVNLERDIPADLARATIRALEVHGVLRASDEVKQALADRIK